MPCKNCSCPSCLTLAGSPIPPTELPLPPSGLMTTNRAATNSEVVRSRNIIESAKQKISLIQVAMNDLVEQMEDTLHFIDIHRASISPLKAFPPELLVAIFTEYINIVTDPWITPTHPEPPLNLMWVCSQWRTIVLDTPQLWTKISSSTPMVDIWVNRSKELPLDLKLDLSSDDVSLLDALIPQAHRWERADLALTPDHHSILAPVKGRLQSLKRLEVSSADEIGFLDFCEGAPQLTEIRLAGVLNPANIMLPWEQLQDCTLPDSRAILHALERAKNIRACCLDMSTPAWWSVSEILPQLRCHSLNTLIVHWRPEDFRINEFFSSLTFLSLEYLEIRLLPGPDYLPFMNTAYLSELGPTMLKFFERSSSHLIALTLDDLPVSATQIADYLAFMPSLISLDLKYARGEHVIEDEFMKRLTLNHANDLLPRLSTLSLRGQAEFCEESLDELIASRRDIRPQDAEVPLLEKLVLDCFASQDWSFSEPPSIHRFVSEGLDIKYGFYWNIMHLAMDMIESPTLVDLALGTCEYSNSEPDLS